MDRKKLPRKVNNSPLILYANFNSNNRINLVRFIKPYKNGVSYAVDSSIGNYSGLFSTYHDAEKRFMKAVKDLSVTRVLLKMGKIKRPLT